MFESIIAANRFGLGARPGELAKIQTDPRAWLHDQVRGARATPTAIQGLTDSAQIFQEQVAALQQRRAAKQAASSQTSQASDAQTTNSKGLNKADLDRVRAVARHYQAQVMARYQTAVRSEESFRERLVHFWSNHFAVSSDKNAVRPLAATLENEAIRPNLHLSFYDLLLAVESHPAMILYLDNQASVGPNSQLAELMKRRANQQRKVDINENLGREILELHTLGVNGGYTQTDVTRFATVLTGWSVGGDITGGRLGKVIAQGTPGKFAFRTALHEPGAQTILGKRYNQAGVEQPLAVLKDLAHHDATAQFIATKLARHFIADTPPPQAVAQIAKAFRDSQGDLPTVHTALTNCDAAWQATANKYKTPHEFVVSTWRALDYVPNKPAQVVAAFEMLGQRPYTPGSPAGWADIAGQWDGPDALMKRIEWATQLEVRGQNRSPLQLAEASLADSLSEHTRMAINGAEEATQGRVLWLMSPEFLRR